MKEKEPEYLGDAVYATGTEDGYLMLTTGSHNIALAHNVIWLEDKVLENLLKYVGKE